MLMRNLFARGSCALFLTALTTAASAGDIDGIITDGGKWSGVYVGANAGYGWSDVHSTNDFGSDFANSILFDGLGIAQHQNDHIDGYIVGGQVGFQRQFGHWVLGVEGTLDSTGIDGETKHNWGFDAFAPLIAIDGTQTLDTRIDNLFQVSGKIGYTFDDWMAYVRGGWAGARIDARSEISGNLTSILPFPGGTNIGFSTSSEDKKWQNGWSIGGGLERMIYPNLTVGVEYNYVDLGSGNYSFNGPVQVQGLRQTLPFQYRSKIDSDAIQTVTFRMNFLLNSPEQVAAAPLK
jgi:outer membrane immunogenic protein